MPAATPANTADVRPVLSEPRFATYLTAASGDADDAAALYGWNARISAALILPAHFAEVATRNAVSEVLEIVYGVNWPWAEDFRQSLPSPSQGYNPRKDLRATASKFPTTGKVIAELKFVFWEAMFTSRHDGRIWEPYAHRAFPNGAGAPVAELRLRIRDDLEAIRRVRNRIAHHEPIFTYDVLGLLRQMTELVELRCSTTAAWVGAMQDVRDVVDEKP